MWKFEEDENVWKIKKFEVYDKWKESRKEKSSDAITWLFDLSTFGESKIESWDQGETIKRDVDMNEFGLKEKSLK